MGWRRPSVHRQLGGSETALVHDQYTQSGRHGSIQKIRYIFSDWGIQRQTSDTLSFGVKDNIYLHVPQTKGKSRNWMEKLKWKLLKVDATLCLVGMPVFCRVQPVGRFLFTLLDIFSQVYKKNLQIWHLYWCMYLIVNVLIV